MRTSFAAVFNPILIRGLDGMPNAGAIGMVAGVGDSIRAAASGVLTETGGSELTGGTGWVTGLSGFVADGDERGG